MEFNIEMKCFFLSGFFPDELYKDIISNSKGTIDYAADALQKSFVEGLSEEYEGIEILNVPFIRPYPQRYKKMNIKATETVYKTYNGRRIPCHCLAFCNLYEYKKISIEKAIYKYFSSQLESSDDNLLIFIYAITTSTLNACRLLKNKYGDVVKTILIVPDLPQYTYNNKNIIRRAIFKFQSKIFNRGYKYVDAFVLLSKYMADDLPVKEKPWTVVEGIFNLRDDVYHNEQCYKDVKVVFYGGVLSIKYGIKNLVDAFMLTNNRDYCLQICGCGDAVDYIRECCKCDARIQYLGQLPRAQVIQLQREATLLVNPRTSEGEYTKYSFPSKTMEYLASGVPTLIYKLPGIPDEYYTYCFSLENESVNALYQKIGQILNMSDLELKEIGSKARSFILHNKNPYEQCKKVKQLTDSL